MGSEFTRREVEDSGLRVQELPVVVPGIGRGSDPRIAGHQFQGGGDRLVARDPPRLGGGEAVARRRQTSRMRWRTSPNWSRIQTLPFQRYQARQSATWRQSAPASATKVARERVITEPGGCPAFAVTYFPSVARLLRHRAMVLLVTFQEAFELYRSRASFHGGPDRRGIILADGHPGFVKVTVARPHIAEPVADRLRERIKAGHPVLSALADDPCRQFACGRPLGGGVGTSPPRWAAPEARAFAAMRSARSSSSYSIGSCPIRLTGDRTPPLPWIVPATRIGWCRLSKEGSPRPAPRWQPAARRHGTSPRPRWPR